MASSEIFNYVSFDQYLHICAIVYDEILFESEFRTFIVQIELSRYA